MMGNRRTPAQRITLGAMFSAMTLIVLYLAAILPAAKISLYFLSSIFVIVLLVEDMPATAFVCYLAVSGLALLIVPNLAMVLPYVLLFGHYGIGKYFIERLGDKITVFLLKMLYFDVFMAAIYLLAGQVFLGGLYTTLPVWAIVIIVQIVFVIYDFIYSKLIQFYRLAIRDKIIKYKNF